VNVVGNLPPKLQAQTVLTQASPVSGTKYVVLATTNNVRIIKALAAVTWTVQPNPLEIHVTVDGRAEYGAYTNPVSTSQYGLVLSQTGELLFYLTTSVYAPQRAFLIEGKSIKVEAETTGGTVSQLLTRCDYALFG
jgi:hypothetical protein